MSEEYACPWGGCERSFDTKTGVSLHHYRAHGEKYSATKDEYTCEHCEETFEAYPSQIQVEAPYCSRLCQNRAISQSGEDHPNWNRRLVECEWCGDEFHRCEYKIARSTRHYCSDECVGRHREVMYQGENGPAWAGGWDGYYGQNWKRQRRRALERDGHQCVICGDGPDELGKNPDVHHVVPHRCFKSKEAANQLGNLITLCPDHHKQAEHGSIETPTPASPMTPQFAED